MVPAAVLTVAIIWGGIVCIPPEICWGALVAPIWAGVPNARLIGCWVAYCGCWGNKKGGSPAAAGFWAISCCCRVGGTTPIFCGKTVGALALGPVRGVGCMRSGWLAGSRTRPGCVCVCVCEWLKEWGRERKREREEINESERTIHNHKPHI